MDEFSQGIVIEGIKSRPQVVFIFVLGTYQATRFTAKSFKGLFDCDTFSQVPGEVDIHTSQDGDMIAE